MKWTDKSSKNYMTFEKLSYGDGFKRDNILYIKFSASCAFDVIHDKLIVFHKDTLVLPCDCEIIFH